MIDDIEIDQSNINRRVLAELVEGGGVDCECLVQVVQLMMMPEFERFFAALCRVDLGRSSPVAAALTQCAQSLAREQVPG